MLDKCANGINIRCLFVAAFDKEREPDHEEIGHPLRQWKIESKIVPMPKLAGLSPVISYTGRSTILNLTESHIRIATALGARLSILVRYSCERRRREGPSRMQ